MTLNHFPVENNTTTFGLHLMLDAYGGNEERLGDMKLIYAFLHKLPESIGMHCLGLPVIVDADATATGFDPGGITGFQLINESHISIHTFPKRGFLTMDLYSCSNFEDQVATIVEHAKKTFAFTGHELQLVKRGTAYPTVNQHT